MLLPDQPQLDLLPPDLTQPDLSPSDLAQPLLGDAMNDAGIAYCASKYGAAPGYILCWVTPSGCAFNATTNGTCTSMCASLGGTCLAAWDNPNSSGQECDVLGPDPCGNTRGTNICLCNK